MSANQIPFIGRRSEDLPGRPREHSCPTCWKNGGPGHHLDHLIEEQAALRARALLDRITGPTIEMEPA